MDRLDPRQLFLKPVSKADVPDYFDIVKHPMDWEAMEAKLDRNAYMNPDDFEVSHRGQPIRFRHILTCSIVAGGRQAHHP